MATDVSIDKAKGMPNELGIWEDYRGCHPCVCTSSMKISAKDILEKYLPAVGHDYITVHLVGE